MSDCKHPRIERDWEIYLDTTALGYAAAVQHNPEGSVIAREVMHHAASAYAGSLGNLDAKERAELIELRRFRNGIVGLRGELAQGLTSDGRVVVGSARDLAVETIDALLLFHGGEQ